MAKTKLLGARVPNAIDTAVRKRATDEDKTVNDVVIELLGNGIGLPDDVTHGKVAPMPEAERVQRNATQVSIKVMELRQQIEELKSTQSGFFGDPDVKSCVDALKEEIKQLIASLPNSQDEEKESGLYF